MKKNTKKITNFLSIMMSIFLVSSFLLSTHNTNAQLEGEYNQYNIDFIDRTMWKWTTTEVISTESTEDGGYQYLATDSYGNVHIVWNDLTDYAGSGTDYDIFYKRWDISTTSWTTTEVVSTESTNRSLYPSLAIDTIGDVHVIWYDETDYAGCGTDWDVFYKRWDRSTTSWTTTEVVSTESIGVSGIPTFAIDDSGNIHIAWYDETDYAGSGTDADIFYKRWNSSTSVWTTTEVVSTESSEISIYPSLTADSIGNIHIAWYEETDYAGSGTDVDIFYKRWDSSTTSWTITEVVSTESTGSSIKPMIKTDVLNNVHFVWRDKTNYLGSGTDNDIFYKRWDSSTTSWATTEVVSTESVGDSDEPAIALDDSGDIHITWYDKTDYAGSGLDYDIFYKRKYSVVSSWTTTEVVSTESTHESFGSVLDVDSLGYVHISWYDDTNFTSCGTDIDIFYKQLSGPLLAPNLASIIPNPTESNIINLDWNNIFGATDYFVYRSTSYIWSVAELTPIDVVSISEYSDVLSFRGLYYYVIVAGNEVWNSTPSNCQHVNYRIDSFDRSDWHWINSKVISAESSDDSRFPSFAIDTTGNVHITWCGDYAGTGPGYEILYKRWDAALSDWTTTEVVSTESTDHSSNPSLAVDVLGNVHIAWEDFTDYAGAGNYFDVFYKRWEVATSSWTTTEVVSTESTSQGLETTLTTDAAGNVHIIWRDETDYAGAGGDTDIFYKLWNSTTSTWTTSEVVSTESTEYSALSSLAVDIKGNIHVTWYDSTNYLGSGTDFDIFYKRWDSSTSSWTTTEVVSTGSSELSSYPSLATDSIGNVHLIWSDYENYAGSGTDQDIFYKRWDSLTSTWSIIEVISTESTGLSSMSSVTLDATGDVHIAWNDQTDYDGAGIDLDIFYKRWDTSIDTWSTTEVVSTESSGDSEIPSLCVDSLGQVHVVWMDKTDYHTSGLDWDIFYKILTGLNPQTPYLGYILPNPTDIEFVYLEWKNMQTASQYYVYRSSSLIWFAAGLIPIATVYSNNYIDTLPSEGIYYYAIVASDGIRNSTVSNYEYVEYKIPHVREFALISGLILGVMVVSLVIMKTRRNKL